MHVNVHIVVFPEGLSPETACIPSHAYPLTLSHESGARTLAWKRVQ